MKHQVVLCQYDGEAQVGLGLCVHGILAYVIQAFC